MALIMRFEEFLHLPNFFYRCVGLVLWGPSGGLWQRLFFHFSVHNLFLTFLAELYFIVVTFKTDLIEATMSLSYASYVAVALVKYYYMLRRKKNMIIFLQRLEVIFPRTKLQQENLRLSHYLQLSKFVTKSYTAMYMVLISIYNLYAIGTRLIYTNWLHVNVIDPTLPYSASYPWNWHDHWSYYVLYVSQGLAGWHATCTQMALDLLLCTSATQLIMHYDYISLSLEKYKSKYAEVYALDVPQRVRVVMGLKAFREDMQYISGIVAYHAELLSLSQLLNELFGVPLLVNLFTSSALICFLGFQLSVTRQLDLLIKLALFFFGSILQVYLICHFGQLLIDSSTNVVNAVYFHDWIHADIRYQKMLILIAKRAQRPAILNATSFISVSRGTMTDIIQLSYRIFALIRTMYNE
ncbi:odorant receptor 85c-like [Anastrepha ludens]|uniref:odorant receptor 85c-like n=1 Tax=Anastrepha ludens TaxID=28586 RepID=UPI0023AFBD7E|nr:odorant receptor 85c-like [Anastrepha ludens]